MSFVDAHPMCITLVLHAVLLQFRNIVNTRFQVYVTFARYNFNLYIIWTRFQIIYFELICKSNIASACCMDAPCVVKAYSRCGPLFGAVERRKLNNVYIHIRRRPYHGECTGSVLASEIKRHRVRLWLCVMHECNTRCYDILWTVSVCRSSWWETWVQWLHLYSYPLTAIPRRMHRISSDLRS